MRLENGYLLRGLNKVAPSRVKNKLSGGARRCL